MQRPLFLGSDIYRGSSYGAWHPLRVPRVSTVMDLCRALGWLPDAAFRESPMATPQDLTLWHDPAYVAALKLAETQGAVSEDLRARHNIGTHANPVFSEMFRRPATSAGASMLAGEMLADGGIVYSPAGGTHHGMPDHANGFCYLNDPVLAILSLRHHGVRRVAYVDLDAHHPDGVEHAFADDPDTLMISVHEENRWPRTGALEDRGAGQVFNLPVPKEMSDSDFAMITDALILTLVQDFRPDALVLQCGSDALKEDPQSRLALSNNAHWTLVRALMGMARRFLVLGGGGYNPWAVGRCWTGVWAALAGYEIPGRLPQEAESVLRGLEWRNHRLGKSPPDHWFTTLRDAPREERIQDENRDRIGALMRRTEAWV